MHFPINEVIALLKTHNPSAVYDTIPYANHSFDGHEKILAERILTWVKNLEN